MKTVQIRAQRVADAKRFFDILSHPDFADFGVRPASVEDERAFLRLNREKRRRGIEFNFAVTLDKRVVGAIGLKIDQQRRHIGEMGYFMDRAHWGKGLATAAVRLAEQFAAARMKLRRLEILTRTGNRASQRVAKKSGYQREGLLRGKIMQAGQSVDAILFGKVLPATASRHARIR